MNAQKEAATYSNRLPRHENNGYVNHRQPSCLNQQQQVNGERKMNIVPLQDNLPKNHPSGFSNNQIDILKNSICKGVSNEEFEVFLMACAKTQLDPFMKQIYAVKRKMKRPDGSWGESMTIQTGIDGYRLIAERTGAYAPGPEPTYITDDQGKLLSATAYIKKMTRDGTWHTVSASAYIDEYCQKTKEGQPMGLWSSMPRTMLAKCAEAQALRKAFPAEMSGVYTKEEMLQAEVEIVQNKVTSEQVEDLKMILSECDESYQKWVADHLKRHFKIENFADLTVDLFNRIKAAAVKNMEENFEKQRNSVVSEGEKV